jgi:hypothetical protein
VIGANRQHPRAISSPMPPWGFRLVHESRWVGIRRIVIVENLGTNPKRLNHQRQSHPYPCRRLRGHPVMHYLRPGDPPELDRQKLDPQELKLASDHAQTDLDTPGRMLRWRDPTTRTRRERRP